jgi:hypothetical protein
MRLQKLLQGEERSLIWLQIFVRSGLHELLAGAPALWMFLRLSANDMLLPLNSLFGVSNQSADSFQPEVKILELRLHDHLDWFQLVHDPHSPMRNSMVIRDIERLWAIELLFIYNRGRWILQAELRRVLWDWELHFVLKLPSDIFRLYISNAWLKIRRSLNSISQESLVTSEWIEVIP